MPVPLFQLALRTDRDVVEARQRAREIAAELGFDNQDQIRIATAASEIARNAFRYARDGRVEFAALLATPQALEVTVSDSGPGIAALDRVLEGRYRSETGLGMGIIGSRRLMDGFDIVTTAAGTTVRMKKNLSREHAPLTPREARALAQKMQELRPDSPWAEIERQNQELLKTLQELRARQEDLQLLNRELEDTNRGVVALYAELDERADYLRRASELKTRFLSNVSHEFRTPLNSIISLSRLLLDRIDGDLNAEQIRQVRYIESSSRDLQELVNDLLDLAKVEAGKIRIRPKRFEIHELFSALKGMLKPLLADNSSVDLAFEDASGLPLLYTDEGKVSQILRNLVSNALKFTPQGRVTVSAAMIGPKQVRFSVADTGIGIPPEYHETIFREFSQVENPLQELHRGTGLGLPLCRNLATILGGRIWLESAPGLGSTFFVQLPTVWVGESVTGEEDASVAPPDIHRAPVLILECDPDTADRIEAALRESEFQPILAAAIDYAEAWLDRHTPVAIVCGTLPGDSDDPASPFIAALRARHPVLPIVAIGASLPACSGNPACAGASLTLPAPVDVARLLAELRRLTGHHGTRRLLLVDDNEVSRYIVRELLRQPWLQIREAASGTEALASVRDQAPDGLILDILMPDQNGFEVLRQLRADPATAHIPVLIYTSRPLTDAERDQLTAWRAEILRKEDVSTRLSPQPFLEWLGRSGLVPAAPAESHA